MPIVKGEGAWLIDADGKRYLDAISSWWVNIHGHSHPYIAKRISEQVNRLEHVMFAGFTHEPAVELASRLSEHMPEQFTKVFYSDNGSTAVEVALKMAFQYWFNEGTPRKKDCVRRRLPRRYVWSYGRGWKRRCSQSHSTRFYLKLSLFQLLFQEKKRKTLAQLQAILDKEEVASFIYEPLVQGTAGMQVYSPEVLDKMIYICREKGAIIIADEVMTGFGRTGSMFAMDQCEEKPDLIALSKGITGGFLPMGVTVVPRKCITVLADDDAGKMKTFLHGHSYTANPLACAAACASLDLMEKDGTWANINRIENQHEEFAKNALSLNGVAAVRHKGTILAVEYETGTQKQAILTRFAIVCMTSLSNRGIILRPLGNIIYIIPPLLHF